MKIEILLQVFFIILKLTSALIWNEQKINANQPSKIYYATKIKNNNFKINELDSNIQVSENSWSAKAIIDKDNYNVTGLEHFV
jgi:hypothetical protein